MKTHSALLVLALFATAATAELPPDHPPMDFKKSGKDMPAKAAPGAMPAPAAKASAQLPQKAKVLNVINVPSYTYLEVAQDKKTLWIAGPTVTVKKGDVVRYADGMIMNNFHSKTLNRDFPSIAFVNQVVVTQEKE